VDHALEGLVIKTLGHDLPILASGIDAGHHFGQITAQGSRKIMEKGDVRAGAAALASNRGKHWQHHRRSYSRRMATTFAGDLPMFVIGHGAQVSPGVKDDRWSSGCLIPW
jgi:hypothetical protein